MFTFGIIADIQYCDCDDATNFAGTETRYYRDTVRQAKLAVDSWNAHKVLFVAQLGDLIDGQNAGGYGAGLSFDKPQSEVALDRVVSVLARCTAPMYHAIGNHELYNFDWKGLRSRLNVEQRKWRVAPDVTEREPECSFAVRPVEGWTFIMLNSVSVAVFELTNLPCAKSPIG